MICCKKERPLHTCFYSHFEMLTRSGKLGCTGGHRLCLEMQLVPSENNGILDAIAVLFLANVCVGGGAGVCLLCLVLLLRGL